MSDELFLCVHGHFYQPPRENPWIEQIERQDGARPYHDWNERIYHESYLPNSRARILDAKGKIVDITNNFEKMSFNFGPTLASWLKAFHPRTWGKIVEADKVSLKKFGHGNAMAQAYNHMIMPLANERDKVTQVRWGAADFRHHFNREPEGMWLPETACNDATLEVLSKEGIRFVILEPHQAESVRALAGGEWQNVAIGNVDPKRPYRWFSEEEPVRYIDIFFYDGPISKAIGFENVLSDAKHFMDRIAMAKVNDYPAPQMIHVATDGETYGHHKKFGDRALAYVLNVEAPKRGYGIINYAAFLAKNPPLFEVRLKKGEDNEGTSWSCAHGIKRWRAHCGCRGDGPANWTQHWRAPLRAALDWLRDELAVLFEKEGSKYFKDVWAARDEYIEVVLDRSEKTVESFLKRHVLNTLSPDEKITCLQWLEIERHAMLMYTSCGWFFTELSGIETVQIILYAARAIELTKKITGVSLEAEFLNKLELAKSNVKMFKNGRGVYEHFVRPAVVTPAHIVSYYGIGSLFKGYFPVTNRKTSIYCFDLTVLHFHHETKAKENINLGQVKIKSAVTLEEDAFAFCVTQHGLYDFKCFVKPLGEIKDFNQFEKSLFECFRQTKMKEFDELIHRHFGEKFLTLRDLLIEDRMAILTLLTQSTVEEMHKVNEETFHENQELYHIYKSIHFPLAIEFRHAAEQALSHRLLAATKKIAADNFNLKKAAHAYHLIEQAKLLGLELHKEGARTFLSEALRQSVNQFRRNHEAEPLKECLAILHVGKKLEMELEIREAQEDVLSLMKKWLTGKEAIPQKLSSHFQDVMKLAQTLGLSNESLKKMVQSETPLKGAAS